jgi:hypothetical protein
MARRDALYTDEKFWQANSKNFEIVTFELRQDDLAGPDGAAVARMSEAISRVFVFVMVPAYRCAHAGYLLSHGLPKSNKFARGVE